jgi:phosphatidylinositol glycan class T
MEMPLLYAERSFTGHGQERGGVQTVFTNPSANNPVEFVYLESLPWFMKLYLHTLTARLEPRPSELYPPRPEQHARLIMETYYRPSLDRHRGTQLEVRLVVPPNSTVLLSYDFDKAILRYTEYPPDANRGFDIAPAVISILSPHANISLRTTSLLLSLPTPDFSMPYNVIILTSTVMALAFGSIFNLLVRRFVAADEAPTRDLRKIVAKLRGRIQLLWRQFRRREAIGKSE